jgi:hypothetical protein
MEFLANRQVDLGENIGEQDSLKRGGFPVVRSLDRLLRKGGQVRFRENNGVPVC